MLVAAVLVLGSLICPQQPAASPPGAAGDIVARAERALDHNDFPAAAQLLVPYVAAHPGNAAAHFDLAFADSGMRQDAAAIEQYKRGLAIEPKNFAAQLNLGILLLHARQLEPALAALKAATGLRAGDAKAWLELGRAEQQSGDYPAALAAWRKAEPLAPRDEAPHLEAGIAALGQKDYAQAEAQLKGALQLAPGDVNAMAALADLYSRTKRPAAAEAMLRDYLRQRPNDATAHLQLARLLAAEKKDAAARAEFQAGLALDAGNEQARADLAALDLDAGDFNGAIAEYGRLVAAHRDSAVWHHDLGQALLRAGRFAAARQELETAARLEPNLAAAWGALGFVDYKLRDYPRALAALERHGQLAGDDAATYFLRAVCWDELHQNRQAIEFYQKFLAADQNRDPDNVFKARHRLITLQHKGS